MKRQPARRKIHLDFHNSPLMEGIGSSFDADVFAKRLQAAHVEQVVCFAKCHHGMSYYNTRLGTRHPHLSFDLLGQQIEACHRHGIRVSAYLSVVWEEDAATRHPEWQQLGPDLLPRHKTPSESWATVCLNSPYIREELIPQTEEIMRQYDVDGMWYDMVHLDENACYCPWCRDLMKAAGRSYDDPMDCFEHTAESVYQYLQSCSEAIRAINPDVDIEYNSQIRIGAQRAIPWVSGFEIECTPSERGYCYFGLFNRYARTLGLPTCGVTPRFHRIWADFGSVKSTTQLRWETATMMASGAGCSIGDQLAPDGKLEPLVYHRIEEAFANSEALDPWCRDSAPVAEMAVLSDTDTTDFGIAKASDSVWGATRMLLEMQCQFDIIDEHTDFSRYRLLILPEKNDFSDELLQRLDAFSEQGGLIIVSGPLPDHAHTTPWFSKCLGVEPVRLTETSVNYLAPRTPVDHEPFRYVIRKPFQCFNRSSDTEVLADLWEPAFERTPEHFTSHHQAPATHLSDFPGIARKHNSITIAAPVFGAYHQEGDTHCRQIVEQCMQQLMPDRLVKGINNPNLEISLCQRQQQIIVHLVHYAANRRGSAPETIEHIPTLHNVSFQMRVPESVCNVYTAPEKQSIHFAQANGYVQVCLSTVDVHAVVVIEYEKC